MSIWPMRAYSTVALGNTLHFVEETKFKYLGRVAVVRLYYIAIKPYIIYIWLQAVPPTNWLTSRLRNYRGKLNLTLVPGLLS